MLRKCNSSIFEIEHGSMGWAFFWGEKRDTKSVPRATRPDPRNPPKTPCQKVVPPPCKNVQKMAFLGEKACIFGQFVHNFAQK
jgi:hypothetical protein